MSALNKNIEKFLETITERWKKGIHEFKKGLNSYDPTNKKSKTIRTALYGDITIEPQELFFVDSFYLQRLKGIAHMGTANYVYPEARHARFEHSLGVFWMIKRIWESPEWRYLLNSSNDNMERNRKELLFAALLHDVAHGPMSHTSEKILEILGIENYLCNREDAKEAKFHECKAREMILGKDYRLNLLKEEKYWLREALENFDTRPEIISKMIIGDSKNSFFTPLINGLIDADKLDYYQRDAFFTGVPAGEIDDEFLMRTLRYDDESQELYFREKALSTLLNFIENRDYVYSITAYHPVIRIAESMLIVSFISALFSLSDEFISRVILSMPLMDDSDLWGFIELVTSYQNKNEYRKLSNVLLNRLRCRKLYKKWAALSLDESKDYFGMEQVLFNEKSKLYTKNNRKLEKSNLLIRDDYIPLTTIRGKNINEDFGIEDSQCMIFEISPKPKHIEDRIKDIKEDWKNIKIEVREERKSFYEALGNSKDSLAESCAHRRHFLNKVIIMHPDVRDADKHNVLCLLSDKMKEGKIISPQLSDSALYSLQKMINNIKVD